MRSEAGRLARPLVVTLASRATLTARSGPAERFAERPLLVEGRRAQLGCPHVHTFAEVGGGAWLFSLRNLLALCELQGEDQGLFPF